MTNNILLIILDTLRDDRINDKKRTCITPNIDKLISNGVNFTQSTCSVHGTVSSLGSLFSSKWSFKTGLGGKRYDQMNFYVDNYFKIISLNKYNIFTIIPEVISDLGFFKNVEKNETIYPSLERLNDGLGEKILKIFNKMKTTEPWFCYVHLNDLHSPVIAPKSVDNKKFGKNQYDRTLSFIDLWIGKILEKIDLRNTIVILTSDHGQNTRTSEYEPTNLQKTYWKINKKIPDIIEPLKSKIFSYIKTKKNQKMLKKMISQNYSSEKIRAEIDARNNEIPDVYDDVIRVPLILAGGNLPKNKKFKHQVNHIDVFPTIEQLAEFTKTLDNPDGRSLVDLINGKTFEEKPIYIESSPRRSESDSHVIGIRTSEFKYFRDINEPMKMIHLYNLKLDPDETKNIALESQNILEKMEQKLQEIISTKSNKQNQSMQPEDIKKVEKELRKLGYL